MNTQSISSEYKSLIPKIYNSKRKGKLEGIDGYKFLDNIVRKYDNFNKFMDERIHCEIEKGYLVKEGKRKKIKWDFIKNNFYTKEGSEFEHLDYLNKRTKAIKKVVKDLINKVGLENINNYKDKNTQVNMNKEKNNYKFNFKGGGYLEAHSINPEIGSGELERCVNDSLLEIKNKKPIDQKELAKKILTIGVYPNISEIGLKPSFDKYNVPEKLKPYRDAITLGFSDSIIVFRDGKISSPGEIIKAEYRDFASTHLKKIPSKLVPEVYAEGKTIAELLYDWGESPDIVAKFLGLAHFLTPSNGEEFSFVYRTKNLHIAPDCMALSGSTMKFPDRFNHREFNWNNYLKEHLEGEMEEEYCLNPDEFSIGRIHFMNDIDEIPFLVAEIKTPYSTKELAEKAYNQPQPMKEHSIFFSTKRDRLKSILSNFDILPSTAKVIDNLTN